MKIRPKFYGSVDASGEVRNNPNVIQYPVTPKIGILKKTVKTKSASEVFQRYALFRIPGRPTDGRFRTTKIPILRVLHAKKDITENLEFYVELASALKNQKFAWVNERELFPALEGVRSQRYLFVHQPHRGH